MVAQATAERRRDQGLCVECGKQPPYNGTLRCQACREKMAARGKNRCQNFKASGLCATCGKRSPSPGKATCDPCIRKMSESIAINREARKASGLCATCGVNAVDSRSVACDECAIKAAAVSMASRIRKAAKGICRSCPNPASPGSRACVSCRERRSQYHQGFVEKGMCASCKKNGLLPGKTRCSGCISRQKTKGKARRSERAKGGLCPGCSKPASDGHVYCSPCRIASASCSKQVRRRRVALGLCQECGGTPEPHCRVCATCYFKNVSVRLLGTRARWNELKAVFDQQGGVCVYSGRRLVLGVNTSVDHKVPKSRGGTNDVENLQWVDRHINTMKWNVPESEFLEIVGQIRKPQPPLD